MMKVVMVVVVVMVVSAGKQCPRPFSSLLVPAPPSKLLSNAPPIMHDALVE
jgi:hypothetical protein